jgi:hypothetical protein
MEVSHPHCDDAFRWRDMLRMSFAAEVSATPDIFDIYEFLTVHGLTHAEIMGELFALHRHRLLRVIQEIEVVGGEDAVRRWANQPRGEFGWTPLHISAATLDAESVRIMLQRGADASALDVQGRTSLFIATETFDAMPEARRDAMRDGFETIKALLGGLAPP